MLCVKDASTVVDEVTAGKVKSIDTEEAAKMFNVDLLQFSNIDHDDDNLIGTVQICTVQCGDGGRDKVLPEYFGTGLHNHQQGCFNSHQSYPEPSILSQRLKNG